VIIDRIVNEKKNLILEKGERAITPLMGILMSELRGKADGKILNEKLSRKVKEILSKK